MPMHKFLLNVMLASLGLCALAAVVGILTTAFNVEQIVGTGGLCAVVCGVIIFLARLSENEKTQRAGLFGMGASIVVLLLGLMSIWISHAPQELGETFGLSIVAAILMTGCLRAIAERRTHWAGQVALITSTCGFAITLAGIWILPDYNTMVHWRLGREVTLTGQIIIAYGFLASGSLVDLGVQRRWWRWIGIAASFVGCIVVAAAFWFRWGAHSSEVIAEYAVDITGIGTVIAIANVSMLCPLVGVQVWIRHVTIIAAALTSLFIDGTVLEQSNGQDFLVRAAGASGTLMGTGILAMFVLSRVNKKNKAPTPPTDVKELTLICPGCQLKQTVPLGPSSCTGCHLKFTVAVEEPRCPECDYLLYMLKSDRCPECGAQIDANAQKVMT